MLQLTKRTEYGLIALVHMADREGEFVSVREISERYRIPRRLLAEVLKDLCQAKLVDSQRGATGGYTLVSSADELALSEIVAALEGRPLLTSCEGMTPASGHGELRSECDLVPICPIRSPLHRIREGLWQFMQKTTLRSLVQPRLADSRGLAFSGTEIAIR